MSASYTNLKGFNSIYDLDIYNSVEENTVLFFEWGFLNKGAFTSVKLNQNDIYNSNRSNLYLVDDPNYVKGQVWRTFHKNLVWESGLNWDNQPISISGIYVNGSLKTKNAVGFEHSIDFPNGRVIFNSAISTSSVLTMEYSYKTIDVMKADDVPIIQELQNNIYSNNTISPYSGTWSMLPQGRAQNPVVAVELVESPKFAAVELGGLTQWVYADIVFHVFTSTKQENRKLLSLIGLQNEKTIFLADLNLMTQSGEIPLNNYGDIHSGTLTYNNYIEKYHYNKLYFSQVRTSTISNLNGIYHGTVRFTTETLGLL